MAWNPAAWVSVTQYALPDIQTVVQEIVNRAGWASGNAMNIFVQGATSTDEIQASGFGTFSSKLDITYTAGGAPSTLISRPNVIGQAVKRAAYF